MKLHKPNFEKCNLNVSATLAEFLHAPNENATLPNLKKELEKGFEKVVFVCFDGMGIYPLQQNLPKDDFLRKHVTETLLAPFPATTTNATTSLRTNKLPLEHGWFGWSMYFEAMGRNVNIFLNEDSKTGEKLDVTNSPLASFPSYFDLAQTDYAINTVYPPFVETPYPQRNYVYENLQQFFVCLEQVCQKNGKQFVYAYCTEPDHSMHEKGVVCTETKLMLQEISQKMQQLAEKCKNTLFVVTADHGMIDVAGQVNLFEDEKLLDMLNIYPYMEPRAVAFSVKPGKKEEFRKYFLQNYCDDFVLFESRELIEQNYFGTRGDKAHLLGDFVAIGTYTHKIALMVPDAPNFRGHHTGLTEEAEVPLILIACK